MKIGFNPGSIVDTDGTPLCGRVTVFEHDSNTKKNIYTMNGSDYVPSENPVLLDANGRLDDISLFFDVSVVDVLVQKYIGEPGQMSDSSPDSDFEDFDRFEAGFDFDPGAVGAQEVETIDDLKAVVNPSGVVRVNCYRTLGDCAPRYYLWNPGVSSSLVDGGCVIESDTDASGMWCYLCEGDCIKSSVYGVTAGVDETNISNFAVAPLSIVGTYTVTYPNKLYFERGVYSNTPSGILVSNGQLAMFSCDAKFTSSVIYAYKVDVDGVVMGHNYVADFVIMQTQYENSATVRSSWCRTMEGFWGCNAKKLVIDRNHLSNDVISRTINISQAIIEGVYSPITYTFSAGKYLNFTQCHFIGCKWIFHEGDYLKFTECNFSDDFFWSLNLYTVDFGPIASHHIDVDNWKITDATNANVWIRWAKAVNVSVVDLCGRTVTDISQNSFSQISNGIVTGSLACNSNIVLENVQGLPSIYAMVPGTKTLTIKNSVANVYDSSFTSVTSMNSIVTSNTINTAQTALSIVGGSFSGIIKCPGWDSASGTQTRGKAISFRDCVLSLGNFSWFDNVSMKGCTINNPVHVIPALNGSNLLSFVCSFIDNEFGLNGNITFTDSSVHNADVYDVQIDQMEILDNVFRSASGIIMPYYSQNAANKFIGVDYGSAYNGNVGGCPLESIESMQNVSSYSEGSGTYKYMATKVLFWNTSPNDFEDWGNGIEVDSLNQSHIVWAGYAHDAVTTNVNDQFGIRMALKDSEIIAGSTVKIFDK